MKKIRRVGKIVVPTENVLEVLSNSTYRKVHIEGKYKWCGPSIFVTPNLKSLSEFRTEGIDSISPNGYDDSRLLDDIADVLGSIVERLINVKEVYVNGDADKKYSDGPSEIEIVIQLRENTNLDDIDLTELKAEIIKPDPVYILKKTKDINYVYIDGEDPNIPYAEVDYGSDFNEDDTVVELDNCRYIPIKKQKYLTTGDIVTFDSIYKGTIISEKLIDGEFDAITYDDEFTITNVVNALDEYFNRSEIKHFPDVIKTRAEVRSEQKLYTNLKCNCCKR